MTRLTFVRHGESNVTVARVIGGLRTCSGLSALGILQAERLRDRLARTGEVAADVLLASTMPRAGQTAAVIAPALGTPVRTDAALCEHDPGDCDGMSFTEYVERHGMGNWEDLDAVVFPGGETRRQFHQRVSDVVDALVERHGGRSVVVVCHGGVIDAALRHLLGWPAGGFSMPTTNASLTELFHNGRRWELLRYNDAAHLEGLPLETAGPAPSA